MVLQNPVYSLSTAMVTALSKAGTLRPRPTDIPKPETLNQEIHTGVSKNGGS